MMMRMPTMMRKGRKTMTAEERRAAERRCSEAKALRKKGTLEKYAAKKRAEEGEDAKSAKQRAVPVYESLTDEGRVS
jgi:hypothetical protein